MLETRLTLNQESRVCVICGHGISVTAQESFILPVKVTGHQYVDQVTDALVFLKAAVYFISMNEITWLAQ